MSPIRRLAVLAATVLTVALVLGPAGTAQAGASRGTVTLPLKGQFVGHFSTVTPAPDLTLADRGTGNATVLGRFTAKFTVHIDLNNPTPEGDVPVLKDGYLQTVAGDRVYLDLTGTFNLNTGVAVEHFTVTGGTGRFRHASGSGRYDVPPPTFLDPVTGDGFGPELFDGVIQLRR